MFKIVIALAMALAGYISTAATEQVLVINKGIGGHASSDGLKRFQQDVLDVKPDYLIIYFAMNDANNPRRRVLPKVFAKNMQTMIDRAKSDGIKNIILVTPNPVNQEILSKRVGNHPGKTDLNMYLNKFDLIVRKLAEKNKLTLVDLHALCMKYGGGENTKNSLIRVPANGGGKDGVHLTPRGYKEFAKLFIPVFKGKIKPGDVVLCFGDSITYGAAMKGAGTATGETYPAWLSVYLNQLAGTSKAVKTPAPLIFKSVPKNGDMECSSDRTRADFWKIWNVRNRQEGSCRIAEGSCVKGNALKIVNKKPQYPAYLQSLDTPKIKIAKKYSFSFQYKGKGSIRPVILFYGKRNKYLGAFPKSIKNNPWRNGSENWKKDSINLNIPENAVKMRATFRISGTIFLDNVNFTTAANEKQIITNRKSAVSLKNKFMSIKLRTPEEGGGIISICNADGTEFINGLKDKSLWQITLRRLPLKKYKLTDYVKLSLDPEVSDGGAATNKDDLGDSQNIIILNADQVKAKCNIEKSSSRIKLSWNKIDLGTEKGALDVFVEFKLVPNDHFVRIRSGIKNRSQKFTVFYLSAPRITGIYPHDNDLASDRLAVPCYTGRLVYNPIENGILGKQRRFQPNRSGHSMQFDAYYNKGKGLYFGCFDGEQNIKRYFYETSDNGILWAMVNVPDNMKQISQDYTVPYDTVIRCFDGDWYDAARIYRKWALKQSWCMEGPEITRESTPKWYKEIDEWFLWGEQKNTKLMYTPKILKAFKGLNLGVFCTYWGKGSYFSILNPERFPLPQSSKEYIKLAKKHDFKITAYIQGVCWDIKTDSFKKENGWKYAVRNFYGQPIVWSLKDHNNIVVFPGTVWQKVLGNTIIKMAKAGFDCAYLDSNNHAGTYLNFNPIYNKQSGGGNEYIKANRKMMRNIKTEARKYNPGFCFTAESFWEGNIAELDAVLACNTWHRYLKKGVAEQIPLVAAVYHDYTILYSTWAGRYSVENNNGFDFIVKCGMGLVQGFKPGWNQPSYMNIFKNKELVIETSIRRYNAYHASKKFLLYGKMLRPPVLMFPKKRIDFKWWRAWSKTAYNVDTPVVLSSLWKAPDNSFGLVLYNVTDKFQKVEVKLTASELQKLPSLTTKAIWPKSFNAKVRKDSGNILVSCTVPPQSPAIIQIN